MATKTKDVETTGLLKKDEDEDIEELEKPYNRVEFFLDYIVALCMTALATDLSGKVPGAMDWLWFMLQTWMLWSLWNACIVLNNMFTIYGLGKHINRDVAIHVNCFNFMLLMVLMTRFALTSEGNPIGWVLCYIIGRIILVIRVYLVAFFNRNPASLPEEMEQRVQTFREKAQTILYFVPFENVPLVLSVLFFRSADNGYKGILMGGYLTWIISFLWCRTQAQLVDKRNPSFDHSTQEVDLNDIQERHETIAEFLIGSLLFVGQTFYITVCSVATTLGAFLLYYQARVNGRTEAYNISASASSITQNLHVLFYCTINVMCVGYYQISAGIEEVDETEWITDPRQLICFSAGLFLIIYGVLNALTQDPEIERYKPRWSMVYRVGFIWTFGVALVVVGYVPNIYYYSEIFVPLIYMFLAAQQIFVTMAPSSQ